jgi:hypothetical protein
MVFAGIDLTAVYVHNGRVRSAATLVVVAACRFDPQALGSIDARVGDDDDGDDASVDGDVDSEIDATTQPVPECPTSSDLVACWAFEGSGSDGAGNGHDAMLGATSFVPGKYGSAVDRVAGSDITIAHDAALNLQTFTLEMWVQADAAPPAGQRIVLFDKDGQYGVVWFSDGTLECSFANPTSATRAKGGTLAPGPFTHVACSYDAVALRTFVDGVEVATTPSNEAVRTGTATLRLGEDHPSGNDTLDGRLDTVRLWRVGRPPTL